MAEKEKKFQSYNNVELVGYIDKLEVRTDTSPKIGQYVAGQMNIVTGEGETHYARFFTSKTRADRTTKNPLFTEIQMLQEAGLDTETLPQEERKRIRVKVTAQWQPNAYKNRAGEEVEGLQINVRSVKIANEEEEDGANFRVTGAVAKKAIVETNYEGEETDRRKLTLLLVDYRGLGYEVDFIVPDYGADWADELEIGDTISVNGDIYAKYLVEHIERKPENGFGKIVDTKRDIRRENLMLGSEVIKTIDEAIEAEDEGEATHGFLTLKTMKLATEEYNKWKAEEFARADANKKNSAPAKRKSAPKSDNPFAARDSAPVSNPVSDIDNLDLPF